MKVLCTGGNGFLGRHVAGHLRILGHVVWSYDCLDPKCGGTRDVGDPAHIIADICSMFWLSHWIRRLGIEAIVHLAAYGRNLTCEKFPRRAWETNVDGTMIVLESARVAGLKRVVFCSSNIVLSPKSTLYKLTKETGERAVAYYQTLGLSCVALRPSNICGKGQSKTEFQPCAMAGLDASFERHGYLSISGDGEQTRDWIHAEDVARAFGLALESDYRGPALDICTSKQTSLNEIAKLLDVPVRYGDPRPGDAAELISDPQPAKAALGFEAKIGMERIVRDSFPAVFRHKDESVGTRA